MNDSVVTNAAEAPRIPRAPRRMAWSVALVAGLAGIGALVFVFAHEPAQASATVASAATRTNGSPVTVEISIDPGYEIPVTPTMLATPGDPRLVTSVLSSRGTGNRRSGTVTHQPVRIRDQLRRSDGPAAGTR